MLLDISEGFIACIYLFICTVDIDNICERIADGVKHMRNSFSGMTLSKKKNVTFISSWSITDRFSFQIGTITKLNLDSDNQKEVKKDIDKGAEEREGISKVRCTMGI